LDIVNRMPYEPCWRCLPNGLPPVRPELQAALDANENENDFAYAVCRTYDGQAWEVGIRKWDICYPLEATFIGYDDAMAAGAAWLLKQQ
jgi:hypothetical protein